MKTDRGLAAMTPEKRSQIASMGGKAAHKKGTAHEWSTDEARIAGRKGGLSPKNPKRLRRRATDHA